MSATSNAEYPLPLRELGRTGVRLPALGFGAMGMSAFYGAEGRDEEANRNLLREAVELGCTFWDTVSYFIVSRPRFALLLCILQSNIYGMGHNEKLIAPVLAENRDKVFICTKFGIVASHEDGVSVCDTFALLVNAYDYSGPRSWRPCLRSRTMRGVPKTPWR